MYAIPVANEAERYKEVRGLIYWCVNKFRKRYGGDAREMIAEGELAFVRAVRTFDESRGKFSTYLVRCIWRTLADTTRKKRVTVEWASLKDIEDQRRPGLMDAIKELSWDTQTVARLLIEDVKVQPRHRLGAVWTFLRSAGWSAKRIGESFKEIREALS